MKKYFLLIMLFVFTSCDSDETTLNTQPEVPEEPETPTYPLSEDAETYLVEALDIMENNSIKKHEIEWETFRHDVLTYAGDAQEEEETYRTIRYALRNLGDNHSFFREPESSANYSTTSGERLLKTASTLGGARLNERIGYVRIPGFSGSYSEGMDFANNIQSIIKDADTTTVAGWVVDLRHNTGGNMWPMLAGIGPILGEGVAGMFIDPDSNVIRWGYRDGSSYCGDYDYYTIENPYKLHNENPYVAVLNDERTASSGEAVTIAFKKREKTRSFGVPTYGVSTANLGFPLRDGAKIFLTVSTMADREGEMYGYKVNPDETVQGNFTEDPFNDNVVAHAVEWLENQL